MNDTTGISAALRKQFGRTFTMWREAIEHVSDEGWCAGPVDKHLPVRQACHALETADFYTSGTPVDRYAWGSLYGGDWEGTAAEALPDRAAILALLEQVRAHVDVRLGEVSDEALLAPETVYPWTGGSRLATMLYLLRHTQHHLAIVNAGLATEGLSSAPWR